MKNVLSKALRKALAFGLALCMLLPLGIASTFADTAAESSGQSSNMSIEQIKELLGSLSYKEYAQRYSGVAAAKNRTESIVQTKAQGN